jgi:hypothetical protein
MNLAESNTVANATVPPGKGILAADESTGTIKRRFDPTGRRGFARPVESEELTVNILFIKFHAVGRDAIQSVRLPILVGVSAVAVLCMFFALKVALVPECTTASLTWAKWVLNLIHFFCQPA